MYTPEHFSETDAGRLEALIQDYPFGMLVTVSDGSPVISHIPFLYERRDSGPPVLLGHVARANPQWRDLASGQTALAVFQGPHAYVSPSWYGSPGVPTWNYAVVHAYGTARVLENKADIDGLLERLTAIHEARQPQPWKPNFAGEQHSRLRNMIVGFEIPIEKIEGKFKLSQNRPAADHSAVVDRLLESGEPLSIAVAKLMQHNSRTKP